MLELLDAALLDAGAAEEDRATEDGITMLDDVMAEDGATTEDGAGPLELLPGAAEEA